MTFNTEAGDTAPEQDTSAVPGTVDTNQPTQQGSEPIEGNEEDPEKPLKTFTQEELDAAIGKRLAKERRKIEREVMARFSEQSAQVSTEPLSPEQFESTDAYIEALADRKAQEKVQQREIERQRAEVESTYTERVEAAMEKYDDFEQVAYNPAIPITPVMAETIKASELGPDLAYYLGSNPKEATRISQMPPLLQARELGKIEAKISAEPVAKKTTSAPAPISPVTARKSSAPAYDTTDPRSTKTMSDSEWIKAENERVRRMLNK